MGRRCGAARAGGGPAGAGRANRAAAAGRTRRTGRAGGAGRAAGRVAAADRRGHRGGDSKPDELRACIQWSCLVWGHQGLLRAVGVRLASEQALRTSFVAGRSATPVPSRRPRFLAVARTARPTSRLLRSFGDQTTCGSSRRSARSGYSAARPACAGAERRRIRAARSACCARCPAPSRPASDCRHVRPARAGSVPSPRRRRRPGRSAARCHSRRHPAGPTRRWPRRRRRRRRRKRDRIGGHGLDGKVLGQDLGSVAQQQRALDDISHLSHVPLPWIRLRGSARRPPRSREAACHPPRARTARRTTAPAAGSRSGARAGAGCAARCRSGGSRGPGGTAPRRSPPPGCGGWRR